jgi:hypothetical protein
MHNVKELVSERLITLAPAVKDRVIDELVVVEQEKRVAAILSVLNQMENAKRQGSKLKPDANTFDRDGVVISEGYKKETTEAIKKNNELVSKLGTALEEAFNEEKPSFEKVLKLASNVEGKSESGKAE